MRNFRRSILIGVCLLSLAPLASANDGGDAKAPGKATTAREQGSGAQGGFTIEQVLGFSFPETTSMVASPTGDRVAWVSNTKGLRNIWGAEAPTWTGRQITHYTMDDGQEITDLEFSGDGGLIAYVRGGPPNRDNELPNPDSDPAGVDRAVWTVSWAGGAAHKVDVGFNPHVSPHSTAGAGWIEYQKEEKLWIAPIGAGKPGEIYSRGANSGAEWSPDGKRLAFASARTGHSVIGIYDPVKKSMSWAAPTVDNDRNPRWSPDGKSIAFLRTLTTGGGGVGRGGGGGGGGRGGGGGAVAIMVYNFASDEAHRAWQAGGGPNGGLNSNSGQEVFYWGADDHLVISSEQDGWEHIYSFPATGGTPQLLTPGECEMEHMSLTSDRKRILFNSNCGDIDRRHLWSVSVAGGAPEAVTSGMGIEWFPVATASGKWIAYFASDAQHPATPMVRAFNPSQPAGGKAQAMMTLPKEFPADKLVTPKQVIVNAADGTPIHCQLFMPSGMRAGEKRPAIIFVHGGPIREMLLGWHYMYYYSNSYGMNQFLTNRGYIVLSVNYRGGIGYGRAFRMAPRRGAQGASEYQDVLAGVEYLRERDDVDITKIGMWGGSYGGYLTALALARNSDYFATGVDFHGVHDWAQRVAGAGGPTVTQVTNPNNDEQSVARQSSPVGAISTWKSPVLLIQGDDDRNVAFEQMEEMVALLRRQGVQFEQIVFPDEVHDFLMWRSWMKAYKAESDYFDKKLKSASGQAQAAGMQ
ncbi:MAG TPA: prolyl oligopeptidase family serine peptidase [Candidatus Acidoferrales bacterium]|jgi:dipeptidyl aminopeptidase/acylaminoacyl peptidase|nr:prolyl oligopeptidase family serine peptidase [Candidatus Acidoferrales bacterium]